MPDVPTAKTGRFTTHCINERSDGMASGEAYANQAGTVEDLAYVYVEDSSGGFKRMTKAQFINLMGGGSGGSSYTLPAATEAALGGIKAAAKGSGDTVVGKIGSDGKLYVPTYPTALKNPQKLTFSGGVTAEYDGSGAVTVTIPEGGKTLRAEKTASDTTVELQPNTFYVFPEMASLTLTLATPTDTTVTNEYHVVFQSGETATTLALPDTVNTGSLSIEANKIYELSIMENLLVAQSWAVSG